MGSSPEISKRIPEYNSGILFVGIFIRYTYLRTMEPSERLTAYIEAEIIPRYEAFDAAHRTDHVRAVIDQSLALARHYDVDTDMVYVVAAYHDTGLAYGREQHHIHSGEILLADTFMQGLFSREQLAVMRDAIEDHRASSDHAPRTIYGRIVAEADRCIEPQTVIRRTVQYGLAHYPAFDRDEQFERCMSHLRKKYAEGGYLRLWIPESGNARKQEELRSLIRDSARLRETFDRIYAQECGG